MSGSFLIRAAQFPKMIYTPAIVLKFTIMCFLSLPPHQLAHPHVIYPSYGIKENTKVNGTTNTKFGAYRSRGSYVEKGAYGQSCGHKPTFHPQESKVRNEGTSFHLNPLFVIIQRKYFNLLGHADLPASTYSTPGHTLYGSRTTKYFSICTQ